MVTRLDFKADLQVLGNEDCDGDQQSEAEDRLLAHDAEMRSKIERLTRRVADLKDARCCDESPECVHILHAVEYDAEKARADRYAAAIENAPHGPTCMRFSGYSEDPSIPCDCWKRAALEGAK